MATSQGDGLLSRIVAAGFTLGSIGEDVDRVFAVESASSDERIHWTFGTGTEDLVSTALGNIFPVLRSQFEARTWRNRAGLSFGQVFVTELIGSPL